MTIDQLLELPGGDLAALSDAQLVEYLTPYFPATRPGNTAPASEMLSGKLLAAMTPEMRARMERLAAEKAAAAAPVRLNPRKL